MVNIYQSMLTTFLLQQLLVQAGFHPQPEAGCFQAGAISVRLLDAPRLLIHAPSGTHYIAVLSAEHLQQALTGLTLSHRPPAPAARDSPAPPRLAA